MQEPSAHPASKEGTEGTETVSIILIHESHRTPMAAELATCKAHITTVTHPSGSLCIPDERHSLCSVQGCFPGSPPSRTHPDM